MQLPDLLQYNCKDFYLRIDLVKIITFFWATCGISIASFELPEFVHKQGYD